MDPKHPLYTKTLVLIGLVIGVSGFIAGLFFGKQLTHPTLSTAVLSSQGQLRENAINDKGFKYINPLLGCGSSPVPGSSNYTTISNTINNVIKYRTAMGDVSSVAIYLSTPDGRVLINPDEKFYPASLLKVPTMIAYYKLAEEDPKILDKKILYTGSDNDLNSLQFYKPSIKMVPGTYYTVAELLERLIGYSDNNAVPLLIKNIDNNELLEVYNDLGLRLPKESNADFINVGTYANFFRVLYNGTYLDWDQSEKAMSLLAEHDFPQGIQAGVPAQIAVAQKFGEIDLSGNPDTPPEKVKELHDCGLVYYPNHPFILCIMTKGTNFEKLANVIQNIASTAYTSFAKLYPVTSTAP